MLSFFATMCAAVGAAAGITAFAGQAERHPHESETLHRPLEMTFVGDVMFGRYKENGLDRNPESDVPPFDLVESLIEADIAVVNLETPILRNPPTYCPWPYNLRFAAGTWASDALEDAGFTVATLANNHAYDMKDGGLRDTRELLRERGITPVGVSGEEANPIRIVTQQVYGWRVGFLGFTTHRNSVDMPGVPPMPYIPKYPKITKKLGSVIGEARDSHHLIVVLAHWGKAEQEEPIHVRAQIARRLIDLGADMIIGHHSHILQGIEQYRGGIIAHSLGDFLFDKLRDPNRYTGVLRVRYTPGKRTPASVRFHPVVMTRKGTSIRPAPARRIYATKVYDRLRRLSKPFGVDWTRTEDNTFEMIPDEGN